MKFGTESGMISTTEKKEDLDFEILKNDFPEIDIELIKKEYPYSYNSLLIAKNNEDLYKHCLEQDEEGDSSHFRDAVEMTKITETYWEYGIKDQVAEIVENAPEDELEAVKKILEPKLDLEKADDNEDLRGEIMNRIKNELIFSTLVHDLGKNGTDNEEIENINEKERARHLVRLMYRPLEDSEGINDKIRDIKISEFLEIKADDFAKELNLGGGSEVVAMISDELGYSEAEMRNKKMIDFWRDHIFWTKENLEKSRANEFIKTVAVSHHAHDSKEHDPYGALKDSDKKDPASELLKLGVATVAVVDVYQALLKRSGKTHKEALEISQKIFDKALNLKGKEAKKYYKEVLETFKKDDNN